MDLMIGADGRIHAGSIDEFISENLDGDPAGWRLLQTDCRVEALRPIGPVEDWWASEPDRPCLECLEEVEEGEAQ